jgi:low affinity Fe/Cu permease
MDIASLRAKLDNIAEELAQLPEQESVAIEEETIEEGDMDMAMANQLLK